MTFPNRERIALLWKRVRGLRNTRPALAGSIMFCAGLVTWLNDPLGKTYAAWNLPVDIGWQFRIGIFNYGLLCLLCACLCFAISFANWEPLKGSSLLARRTGLAGYLCLLPLALFLLQYLGADLVGMNQLAQHSKQLLFMKRHFGYTIAKPLIPLDPLSIDISTIYMRFQLLVDQISIGPLLCLVSACVLFTVPRRSRLVVTKKRRGSARIGGWLLFMLALVVVCGRAPASFVFEQQARALLAQGEYAQALQWLDRAATFNPALHSMTYYHIERGEALYFLRPDQQSDESQLYLAATYLQQRAIANAYRQLYPLWQSHQSTIWISDEMSSLLERLAETARPLITMTRGLNVQPLTLVMKEKRNEVALSWLEALSNVDPANVYTHYMLGRINFDLQNYAACIQQMSRVIELSSSPAIQSSAYTYSALSKAGQGDYIDERTLLLKAIDLDPSYSNNTAREELSGLR
jgi:Tetratricopeptide repeat